jgi:hypothetical protein
VEKRGRIVEDDAKDIEVMYSVLYVKLVCQSQSDMCGRPDCELRPPLVGEGWPRAQQRAGGKTRHSDFQM